MDALASLPLDRVPDEILSIDDNEDDDNHNKEDDNLQGTEDDHSNSCS